MDKIGILKTIGQSGKTDRTEQNKEWYNKKQTLNGLFFVGFK